MTNKPNPYPECTKMRNARSSSQPIGDFLEWCQEQGLVLCSYNKHRWGGVYEPHNESTERLLARHLDIDLDKVEEERRAMLEELQKQNAEADHANPTT
jgi:hypothetical protein